MNKEEYKNPNVLTDGEFDETKALLDTSDNNVYNIRCEFLHELIHDELGISLPDEWLQEDKERYDIYVDHFVHIEPALIEGCGQYQSLTAPLSIDEILPEDEYPDEYEQYKDVQVSHTFLDFEGCFGICAALINLARNRAIYEYFTYQFSSLKPNGFPLELPELRISIGDIESVFHTYYKHMENFYIRQAKKDFNFDPDLDEIAQQIAFMEWRNWNDFSMHSSMYYELSDSQRKDLKRYADGFLKYIKHLHPTVEIGNVKPGKKTKTPVPNAQDEKSLFRFIHPAIIDDDEKVKITKTVQNLVKQFPVKEICSILHDMGKERKLLLTWNVDIMIDELRRMGMPDENKQGFSTANFKKFYSPNS